MLCLRQPADQLKFHHVMLLLLLMCILKLFRAHSRECFFCFAPIPFSLSLRTYTPRLHFMPTLIHASKSANTLRNFSSWNILNHDSLCNVCNHGTLSIANEFSRCNWWFVFFIGYTIYITSPTSPLSPSYTTSTTTITKINSYFHRASDSKCVCVFFSFFIEPLNAILHVLVFIGRFLLALNEQRYQSRNQYLK